MVFRDGVVGYEIDEVNSHYDANHQLVDIEITFKDEDVPDKFREFAVNTLWPLLKNQKTSVEYIKQQMQDS